MSAPASTSSTPETATDEVDVDVDVDVAILGGGICGLTLALQLRRALPEATVVVVERSEHPVPEAAHKVGESSVEVQAHYLRDVLGLDEHLEQEQLHKFGLRMFFSSGDNTDLARRVEYGQVSEAPLPSYQLDRGRLENALGRKAASAGVEFADASRVEQVELEPGDRHLVHVRRGQARRVLRARWVVDATGRAGLLKRKLGLSKAVGHRANSSWFRVAHPIDVEQWSDDPEWRGRVPGGQRRLSTNHLMGHGYWVWLIPLASGATSVGIVADATLHPHEGFDTLPKALAWLAEHEPQCAAAVREQPILDFRVMHDYAYGCRQVYSPDRWCLTGEAGVSVDPLYSSGGDLMAISNTLITDLVRRDLGGEHVTELAVGHNQVYLVLAEIWLVAYQDQYPVMGNAQVMVAKVVWDTIIYWAVPGLLAFHNKYQRLAESPQALANLYRTWIVHTRVQQFFREWHAVESTDVTDAFADPYSLLDWIVDLHNGMAAGLPDDELDLQFTRNVALLEQLAGQLATTVGERLLLSGPDERASRQIEQWRSDPLLAELRETFERTRSDNPIDDSWINLGHHAQPVGTAV